MQPRTPDASDRIVEVAVAAALAWFSLQAVLLALRKYFSIDEFQYAHAAWLVARGHVPYRDFFEVHFPLVYQALAPVFVVAGDDPRAVLGLRAGMLVFLAVACVAAGVLVRDRGRVATLAAPLLLLALPPFVTLATEIRPDAAALALFLAALAVLRVPGRDVACAFASGLLLIGALWGSQKAAFYAGLVFAPALLLDVLRPASDAGTEQPLLRSPRGFVAGAASGLVALAAYLVATRSWAAWWSWCFAWAAEHQRHYPGFSWRRYFDAILVDSIWLFALGAIGLAATLRDLSRRGRSALRDPELLLVVAVASTFASFALQRAPYPYSLLPFLALVAIFAARACGLLLATSVARPPRLLFGLALGTVLALQSATIASFVGSSNARQLEVLARIAELTAPTDPAYDNSGGYVARPHAYSYFYTDSYLREAAADELVRDVPRAIVDRGAVLHLFDLRFESLPEPVRAFLLRHFQPLDGDVALWGQRYQVPSDGRLEDSFLAVRDDRYFVDPPSALERGTLTIDGAAVRERVFALGRGYHRIEYTGPPGEVSILWLPHDGKPWQPRPGLAQTFSRLF